MVVGGTEGGVLVERNTMGSIEGGEYDGGTGRATPTDDPFSYIDLNRRPAGDCRPPDTTTKPGTHTPTAPSAPPKVSSLNSNAHF